MAKIVQDAGNGKSSYLEHFGFKQRPFGAAATGARVFVGPQAANTIAEFKKGVATADAVVTVSGHKGIGKTTLVHRALDTLGIKYKTIRVGCLKMNSSEVLESLLVVLGVRDRPRGTMQRFAALRKTLREHQERDVRIFIVIEDAVRTGIEALAEMEAMTAANAGDSDGASIVVMGKDNLEKFLANPQLSELRQRITQQQSILPLSAPEMTGYLVHAFRHAGADFHEIFDATSVKLIYALSGGIPRRVNRLAEAAMVYAENKGLPAISAALVATVARDKYGIAVEGFDAPVTTAGQPAGPDASADAPGSASIGTDQEAEFRTEIAPLDTEAAMAEPDELPTVIQDTLDDQKALSPDSGGVPGAVPGDASREERPAQGQTEPEPDFGATIIPDFTPDMDFILAEKPGATTAAPASEEPPTEIVPELEVDEDEDMATMVSVPGVVPEPFVESPADEMEFQWDAEPATPEFVPDLNAIEQAMADQSVADDGEYPASKDPAPNAADAGATGSSVNIHILDTLDENLQQSSDEGAVELDQVAADIGNPQVLADVDDKLAETLFGSEFRCLSDEEILELQREDATETTPDPAGADPSRPTVIPVAQEAAVDGLVSANDEDSGEGANKGRKR